MKKYGLIGHPLVHSFSHKFHNSRFAQMGIDAIYENFDLEDISLLPDVLRRESELCGLNVTIPYKQSVMKYLDCLDPRAAAIRAVNVIKITRLDDHNSLTNTETMLPGIMLKGYNSDVVGFAESIRPMLNHTHQRALVLGTGGASKAVIFALKEMGITPTYVSRTPAEGVLTYADLTEEIMTLHTVIVNCSPVGTYPNIEECPNIPYNFISHDHVCFDLVYNPAETLFMKRAAQQGASVKNGEEMLIGQAIEAYRIWTEDDVTKS